MVTSCTMATVGVETIQNDAKPAAKSSAPKSKIDKSFYTLLIAIVKRATIINAIYFIGYLNWSVTWILMPMIFVETHKYWHGSNHTKRNITRESAATNEKDVILARIKDFPSWVYFPDFERCEWANRILQQLWPNMNEFLKHFIKNWLERKIRKSLAKKKLNDFEFDCNQLIFGTTAPRIGGIKVYDRNISRDEIIIDAELIFMSDCNINCRLAGLSASLKDFEIHGMIRIIMKPIIPKSPFIGGMQIFFLDKPHVDFDLDGANDLLKIPYLRDMLRRVIEKKIAKIMVWPNKYPIKLTKKASPTLLKMPQPEGVLRIHIIEARDLIRQDIGGKSDPYAICTIGNQQFRTRTIYNTLNPIWDFVCEACIDVKCPRPIQFHLYDWDRTGGSDPLGSATVDISHVVKNGTLDTWIYLGGVKHGELHVRFIWHELSSSFDDLPSALAETKLLEMKKLSSAVLSVYIDSASDLPQINDEHKPDPFVILSVGSVELKTSSKKETDSPVWEQGFTFLVANPEHDSLQIRVAGKNPDEKHGDNLGQLTFKISELLTQNDLQMAMQSYQLKKSGPTSKITMSLALKILKKSETLSNGPIVLNETPAMQNEDINEESFVSDSDVMTRDDVDKCLSECQQSAECPMNSYGLGSVKITLHYSNELHYLSVTIHKIINIPLKDQSAGINAYIKLYLLPGHSSVTKKKTKTIKDTSDPVYETTFRYLLSPTELKFRELELVIATKHLFYNISYGTSSNIGRLKVSLDDADIATGGTTKFYDILPQNILYDQANDGI